MALPEQQAMGARANAKDAAPPHDSDRLGVDDEEAGPSPETPGKQRAAHAATAAYILASLGHVAVLRELWLTAASTETTLFLRLAAVQACLAFEAAVYALGDFALWRARGIRGWGLAALELAGRMRMLLSSVAWVWLVPWVAELNCRCGGAPPPRGAAMLSHSEAISTFVCGYFALRELTYMVRGEPPSALDGSVVPKLGDCLPSNALLGGQFRLDKAELEDSGRVVFVPSRPRQGLYAAPGLAMLANLLVGVVLAAHWGGVPWLLLGSGLALLCRKAPDIQGDRKGATDAQTGRPRRDNRDLWRLLCRAGEVWWMWCCINQLRQCQAQPDSWLPRCVAAADAE